MSGPRVMTRSRSLHSAVSFDASSSGASAPRGHAHARSRHRQGTSADRGGQRQEDVGEGNEEAVEVGSVDGGVGSSASTVSISNSVGSRCGHVAASSGSRPPGHGYHYVPVPVCTSVADCTHCCKCHVRYKSGWTKCTVYGAPRPDCECNGDCAAGDCTTNQCAKDRRDGVGHSSASEPSGEDSDEKLQAPNRRHSSRPSIPPALLSDEQAAAVAANEERLVRLRDEQAAAAAAAAAAQRARQPLPTVADITSHKPLHTNIAHSGHQAWIRACEPSFEEYRLASALGDVPWMASALAAILQLPGVYLFKDAVRPHVRAALRKHGLQSSRWQAQRLLRRLVNAAAAQPAPAAAAAPVAAAAPQQAVALAAVGVDAYDSDDEGYAPIDEGRLGEATDKIVGDMRAQSTARRHMNAGHVDMASRALASDSRTLDCGDPEVVQQLRQLHPPAAAAAMPALPNDAIRPMIRNDPTFVKLVRSCNNGKAAGPSGWSGAMLAVLTESPACMEGLSAIVSDITQGRIPDAVRPHITATRLIALAKPNGKPRPIAMGELFYRIAAIRAVRGVADAARTLLTPHQYGVGVPGGCEQIVHTMQHALTHVANDTPLAAVKVDISNAFNTCQRPRLLALLLATPQLAAIHRMAHWAYSKPTVLIPQCSGRVREDSFVESANGVRQGDPLSTLLFCLYMKPALDALATHVDFAGKIQLYAYVDDVHIVGPPALVIAAYRHLEQELQAIELVVNRDKCSLVYFHNATHPLQPNDRMAAEFINLQWPANSVDSTDVLGAAIGVDAEAIAARLREHLGGAHGLFGTFIRRVSSGGLAVQAAMLLLAHSVSKLGYLLRCLPPNAVSQLAADWDRMLLSAAASVLGLTEEEASMELTIESLQRPRRLGGMGLSSAVTASPLAFVASIAATAAQPGMSLPTGEDMHDTQLRRWLREAMATPVMVDIQRRGCNPMCWSASRFTKHYKEAPESAAHLQRKLTNVANKSNFDARVERVRASGDDRELARLHGGCAKYASRWKTVVPMEKGYRLADEFYQYSARRDIGLPPTASRAMPSTCGACGLSVSADGLHGGRCIRNRSFTKMRHDSIEMLLHSVVNSGIGWAMRQQRGLPGAERTVPDLTITLGSALFLCDVKVTDPLATTNLAESSKGPGVLAEKMAQEKKDKYERCAAEMGATHLPFVVETMGGLSESAVHLLQEIHHTASTANTWRDADRLGAHMLNTIAIAVQECTGRSIRASNLREQELAFGPQAA